MQYSASTTSLCVLSFLDLALLDPNACYRKPPMTVPFNTILIENSPLIVTIDSFSTIHKDLLVEIPRIFK
jgi:hypothetical protein